MLRNKHERDIHKVCALIYILNIYIYIYALLYNNTLELLYLRKNHSAGKNKKRCMKTVKNEIEPNDIVLIRMSVIGFRPLTEQTYGE